MINWVCGKDLVTLGIRAGEGLDISAFLDRIEKCSHCRKAERALVDALNQEIGGEKEY